jgi:NAD(P) transhydrogenase subunit alpha
MKFSGLTIGVPKEILAREKRVAVTPDVAKKFVDNGAKFLIESPAGEGAVFFAEDYAAVGAEVVSSARDIYSRANLILKVKEPQFNNDLGKHEAELIKEGGTIVAFLHPAHDVNHKSIKILAERGITSFTLDSIPRISKAQPMDALTSMSTIAGYKSVIFGANRIKKFIPMMPTSAGMIPPSEVIVVGAGVAGLQAIATAKRLGAKVKALDIRPEAAAQAKSLGVEVIPFDVPQDLAVGKGGYAKRLPKEWYEKEREVLAKHLATCDILILSALIPGEVAPTLVTKEMVDTMKKGSVIVDIAIDQGGNCEVTHEGEEYDYNSVWIIGILNIPATLSIDSTRMFSSNIWYFVDNLVKDGKVNVDMDDQIIRETLVTRGGSIVHHGTLLSMGLIND